MYLAIAAKEAHGLWLFP